MRTTFVSNVPQYKIQVDREQAKALGVPIASIFETMQSTFGSLYVNDFTLFGRNYQVNLQSEANFRQRPEDLKQVFVKSNSGSMIPIDILLRMDRIIGPDQVDRFNAFAAAKVMGNPAPGYSSGQAIKAMQEVASQSLPTGYQIAWTGSAFQEIATGGTGSQALIFGLIMVFLILAAQYERWSLPLAVVLAVPFALFGALVAIWLRGLNNDVYFQIGLVTLIGLASKNAILIVEFAVLKRREGLSAIEAATEAAKLRFRPIIMTSLAFILGCVPLAISSGAGAASRHSIGTGVIGGMLAATFIAVFFIPLFYRLVSTRESGDTRRRRHHCGGREVICRATYRSEARFIGPLSIPQDTKKFNSSAEKPMTETVLNCSPLAPPIERRLPRVNVPDARKPQAPLLCRSQQHGDGFGTRPRPAVRVHRAPPARGRCARCVSGRSL